MQPGTPYERLAVAPAVDRLRVAIAAIMRKAMAPELCKSAATLTPKWEKLRQNPGEAALKPPQLAWLEIRSQLEPEGKGFSFIFFCQCRIAVSMKVCFYAGIPRNEMYKFSVQFAVD
jgi:hypothetical protein